jgi:importin-5
MCNDGTNESMRESAFKIFASSPNLIMDLQTGGVLQVLRAGLTDPSPSVRFAALEAGVAYLSQADQNQLNQATYEGFMGPMLETISLGGKFIQALLPLPGTHPSLFADHLGALLRFLPGLILPKMDSGPTPTAGRPFPFSTGTNNGSAPTTPPAVSSDGENDGEEEEETRQLALEFMITLSEAKPSMVKKVDGWVNVVVRACLEGMSEFEEEEGWEDEDVRTICSRRSPFHLYVIAAFKWLHILAQ